MKRENHISKLIRESGVIHAPDNFTDAVMDKIEALQVKKPYKSLIGRGGRILIFLFFVALVAIGVFFTDPSGELFGTSVKLPQLEPQWPQLQFNLEFLKQVNISKGVVAALVAAFLLILADTGLSKRRLTQ